MAPGSAPESVQVGAIGILLAGGASRRFPGGKLDVLIPSALADLRGRPELAGVRVLDAAYATLAAAVSEIYVLGDAAIPAAYVYCCCHDAKVLERSSRCLMKTTAIKRLYFYTFFFLL